MDIYNYDELNIYEIDNIYYCNDYLPSLVIFFDEW